MEEKIVANHDTDIHINSETLSMPTTAEEPTSPKKRGRKTSSIATVHKVKIPSRAVREEKLKSELLGEFFAYLEKKYGTCLKVIPYGDSTSAKHYSLASPTKDETGHSMWIKVDVSIPHGDRSTGVYDGYEMAERFKENVAGTSTLAEEEIPF